MESFKLLFGLTWYPVTNILYFIKCTAKQIMICSITIDHTLAVLDSNRSDIGEIFEFESGYLFLVDNCF